jgi:hypothetical protein
MLKNKILWIDDEVDLLKASYNIFREKRICHSTMFKW